MNMTTLANVPIRIRCLIPHYPGMEKETFKCKVDIFLIKSRSF